MHISLKTEQSNPYFNDLIQEIQKAGQQQQAAAAEAQAIANGQDPTDASSDSSGSSSF